MATSAKDRVFLPGLFMMILSGIWLVLIIAGACFNLFVALSADQIDAVRLSANIGSNLATITGQGIILYGSSCMIKLKEYSSAMTAMIMALIPCFCSPMLILGFPIGIWGIVVLCDDTVKRSFR